MYNWDDIVIIGDSWCAERTGDNHWPKIFTNKITEKHELEPRGKGFPGASWWSVRKRLLEELSYKPIKLLILCHTEANRIPSDYDYGYNYWSVLENQHRGERFDAAVKYFEHLHSLDYYRWCQLRWFDEVDSIIKENNIEKVIHLHCFPDMFWKNSKDSIATYKFKTGITIQDALYNYRDKTLNPKKFPNHLTDEQNYKLAKILTKLIDNYLEYGQIYTERLNLGDCYDI
jgi:hypothetical protein